MRRGRRSSSPPRASHANVVSMPSWDRFAAPERRRTRTTCCPPACRCCRSRPRVTFGWERYADESIGIDRFGASAPGERGAWTSWESTSTNVVAAATRLAQAKG